MDFELTESERAFRDEVRGWLKENAPRASAGEGRGSGSRDWVERGRAWQRKLHEAGYIGIGWPKE